MTPPTSSCPTIARIRWRQSSAPKYPRIVGPSDERMVAFRDLSPKAACPNTAQEPPTCIRFSNGQSRAKENENGILKI